MPAILALVLIAIVAVIVVSVALHILFSPWALILAAIGILAWMKVRPRRSRQ
jgi:hypothetical protein